MVKRETYLLVDLTAYRIIQDCKYKQFLQKEFCVLVKLIGFLRVRSLLCLASEGAGTPRVTTFDAHGGKDFLTDL